MLLKKITRALCLIICFQLAVGCNSSQLAVSGGGVDGESLFNITGTVVKTFEKFNGLLMSSAIAAADTTAEVQLIDYTDYENPIVIDTLAISGTEKSFKFKVAKKKVENRIVKVEYLRTDAKSVPQAIRQTVAFLPDDLNDFDVVLDADGSIDSAIMLAEIKTLITSDSSKNNPESIKNIIKNYSRDDYANFYKTIGSTINVMKTFKDSSSFTQLAEVAVNNRGSGDNIAAIEVGVEVASVNAKAVTKEGIKLNCQSGAQPLLEQSSEIIDGDLLFYPSDATTEDLFGEIYDAGRSDSLPDLKMYLKKLYEKFIDYNKTKGVTLKGTITLLDHKNDIKTSCSISQTPSSEEEGVKADSLYFDQIIFSKIDTLEAALAKIDSAYGETIQQLQKDFDLAGLKFKDADADAYQAQVSIIKVWAEDMKYAAGKYY